MRLAAKFTIALMIAIVGVLSVHTLLHLRRVTALYEREMRDDLTILARALGTATAEIWRTSGAARAKQYVEGANERRARTQIQLRAMDALAAAPITGCDEAVHATLSEDTLVAYVPVRVGDEVVAVLDLRRGVRLERADLHGIVWTQVGTTAALAILCAALVLGLGYLLVGRPVETLITQARGVGLGDFAPLPELHQRDEIGRLAREMNAMSARLQKAQAMVREQHHDRTALLEQLRHADRLSTVGKLASGIAHQLGTPLNVVTGRAGMIASGEAAGEEITQSAEIIVEQATAMTTTIRQLLDFSRRSGLQRETTILVDVLSQAQRLVEPIAEQRGVRVTVDAAADLSAEIDAGKTLQVVTNLMMNAIQAMPDGGRLRLLASKETVDDPLDRRSAPGEYVLVGVQDDGIGMSIDQLEHIFEPFFTTKSAGQGTGLGLTVCDGIVRDHGGWIDLQTMQGAGSCFVLYLPADTNSTEEHA